MESVAHHVDGETTFWEVGAAWGYFTMAAAGVANQAVAFESRPELVTRITESAARNGYENVTAVSGVVGRDVDLSEYPAPDLVVMDIEGWEYEALTQNPAVLDANPVLIVEIHDPAMVDSSSVPAVPPERTTEFLEDNGYVVEQLDGRSENNYHVIAKPARS